MPEGHTPRTVLVTGATSGIGYALARRLAADENVTVVLHARTAREGDDAAERLVKDGAEPLRLRTVAADFSRLADVATMARRITAEFPHLDVLVNNAAVAGARSRILTVDGHELTLQVNYLAPYLLTRRLWPALTASPSGRVVNVSSVLHRDGQLHWNDLSLWGRYTPFAAYTQSKLALSMLTTALAERGGGLPKAVSVHPGIVATDMLGRYAASGAPVTDAVGPLAWLAGEDCAADNGGFYERDVPRGLAPLAVDRAAVTRLWELTARLTGQSD
ncbi:SDR family NAD(P)-dependent oxidoreductase [Longispora urticae]